MNKQAIIIGILCLTTLAPLIYIIVDKTGSFSDNDPEPEPEIKESCGYDACKATIHPDKLNIHMVAHTHDDAGWLSTVDTYYINRVNTILNTVLLELEDNPERVFTWVEISFFTRWWRSLEDRKQKSVKNLVKTGQLQFALGHWAMADEAVTYYADLIENAENGMRFLEYEFGQCGKPLVGWQVDPFGHSQAFTKFFKDFGYDGFFIGRIDYEDYKQRMNSDNLEFMWDGLWTSVNYNVYRQPQDFCWDVSCDRYRESDVQNNGFMVDDPELEGYNVNQRVEEFLKHVTDRTGYKSNQFMVTMGNDFHYINANKYFVNMDKLIEYINLLHGDKFHAFYSTPTCYMHAVKNSELESPLTEYHSDFFPYCDGYFIPFEPIPENEPGDRHGYWSGYYTSRSSLKKKTRQSSAVSMSCNQWEVAGLIDPETSRYLGHTVSLLQHHDAVTGTEKFHVVQDYDRRLNESMHDCNQAFAPNNNDDTLPFISVYNPLAWNFDGEIELPNGQKQSVQVPAMGETVIPAPASNTKTQNLESQDPKSGLGRLHIDMYLHTLHM